jgi:hypothetical protein
MREAEVEQRHIASHNVCTIGLPEVMSLVSFGLCGRSTDVTVTKMVTKERGHAASE